MEEKQPLISVIIPVYNTEKYVERCLDSVFQQTYKNIEIVVVNNGSTGNINEIVEDYRAIYPSYKILLVKLQKNQGIFKARIAGVNHANGDYITFIDSDDRISIDYYRLLVKEAMKSKADMVAADILFEFSNGCKTYINLSNIGSLSGVVNTNDLLKTLFDDEGLDFTWHCVWNKIYSIELWRKSAVYFKSIDKHLVMCEDMLFSTIFYAMAEKMSVVKNVYYYYYKNDDAYTSLKANYNKFSKNINDLATAFDEMEKFLKNIGKFSSISNKFYLWKKRYFRLWIDNIKKSSLNPLEKKKLKKLLSRFSNDNIEDIEYPSDLDSFFYNKLTLFNDGLDEIKRKICDPKCKYISFDVFDTLIQRPFWEPKDIFNLLDPYYRDLEPMSLIKFSDVRGNAEISAREMQKVNNPSYQEVTLEEIYATIHNVYNIEKSVLHILMEKEIELEKKYVFPRKSGKELFDLAHYLGKRIFITSDMYLGKNYIIEILKKCGYIIDSDEVYVSSNLRVTKYSGDLYKYIIKTNKIRNTKTVLHIGDNEKSDIIMANRCGFNTAILPKATTVFKNEYSSVFAGRHYNNIFLNPCGNIRTDNSLNFLGIRCMLSLIANKFFDNPFHNFNEESDFNANPQFIGYYVVGMHMFSLVNWLIENLMEKKYKTIHFIARDGYLAKKVYDVFKNYLSI